MIFIKSFSDKNKKYILPFKIISPAVFSDGLHMFQYILGPDLQVLQPAKMSVFCLSKAVKNSSEEQWELYRAKMCKSESHGPGMFFYKSGLTT